VRVLGSNGVAQTVAARGGTASNVAGAWTTRTANISAWAGQTIQLRVEALDANPGSLIEAGVHNVTIIRH
jgi:aminopeptidase S